MKVVKVLCLVSTVFAICGCTPEETFVVVNASALKKAVSGELANAKVEMVFDIQDKSDPDLPNKIRKAALPYLGEGAVVELEKTEKRKIRTGGSFRDDDSEVEVDKSLDGAKLVARFSIPVGMEEVLNSAPRSIMWLKYTPSDKTFLLVNGNAIRGLNSALSSVNDGVSYEYDGGGGELKSGTTIKIVNDSVITIGIAAAKVNGDNIIANTFNTVNRSLRIKYNNSFYDDRSPCFVYGPFQAMNAIRLKKANSWDD